VGPQVTLGPTSLVVLHPEGEGQRKTWSSLTISLRVRDAHHRVDGDPVLGGDHADAWPILLAQRRPDCSLNVAGDLRPTQLLAPQACTHALLYHCALELGENAHHLKHGLAGRRRGVEALLMQEQVDAQGMQLGQERHQVLQAAAQANARQFAGGLMSYGIDLPNLFRQSAVYADRILKGASPPPTVQGSLPFTGTGTKERRASGAGGTDATFRARFATNEFP
jgi:hypothetical protein